MTESGVPMDLTGWWARHAAGRHAEADPRPGEPVVHARWSRPTETKKFLNGFGGDPFINTPEAAQALFLKAIKDWGDYVRLAKIVPQG